ncbi:Serine protease, subtilase family [Candidatus Methanophagaceae archaeon]|nr:Serine protease, subtilase family [Methanophagales archaeon]
MMKKILSCLAVFVILIGAMSVSVLAINSSDNGTEATNRSIHLEEAFTGNNSAEVLIPFFNNNTTSKYRAATRTRDISRNGGCVDIPPADMPMVYLTDTEESAARPDSDDDTDAVVLSEVSAENISVTGCAVHVEIVDDTCVGYEVYVDDVYQFTEGQSGTPDGFCSFYVTEGTHTIAIRKNGRSFSITADFQCGHSYSCTGMPDYWCNGEECDNPPTVTFDKTAYYEGDTVHITVSSIYYLVYPYEIKDCSGSVHQSGDVTGGDSVSYIIPSGASECCNWKICFEWDEGIGPAEAGVNMLPLPPSCTKCYEFYVCPEPTCEASVTIEDLACFGYEVYVDGEYQFTEGQSGSPDGKCTFSVTEGTHTIEICKDGCSEIIYSNHIFNCGGIYRKTLLNYWCICNNPDLIIQDISWSPDNPEQGDTITFTVTIKNIGEFTADQSTVKYYINNQYHDFDNIPSLSHDATSTQTFTWTASSGGFVHVKAVADADNNVQEYDKFNNVGMESLHVGGNPDLIIQALTLAPTKPKKGDSVTFTVTIKNQGDADAESSHVRLCIRSIEVDPASASVGPIAAGSTVRKTFTWTADSCAKTAVSVIVDADKELEESREDNNYLLETIYVKCPDLEITDISWSPKGDDLHAGDDVTISYKIKNKGDVDAEDFKTSILIDSLPFRAFTQSLSANTETTEECTWKAVKGTHRIKVEADAQKEVDESDETNNEYRADIVVDDEPVDLLITGIEVTQAIQNLEGDVPLIEGKDTFVRVYMKTNSKSITNVKGTLKCFRNSKPIGKIQNLNTWNYIEKDSGKKRPSIDERRSDDFYLLLFKLPDEWLSGDITIKVEIEPDPRYTLEQLCSCTPCERKRQFYGVDKITIAFVPIHHNQSNTKPDFGDIEKVYQEFVKLYPVSKDDVSIEIWPPLEIDYNPTNNESTECPTAWSQKGNCGLQLLGDIQFLASYQTHKNTNQNLIVYGLVDSELKSKEVNRGPLWGYGEMGDGKTFGTRCAWGIAGTFGGSYMAHGIGHNLGRKHIDCGGPKNIDTEWPYPGDECHLAPETPAGFWGFDVNERSVRAPSEYSDFMTYSAPYWVSNYTYTALFELIKSSSQSSLMVMLEPPETDMIQIRGSIFISANKATFDDFFHPCGTPQTPSSISQHRIELQSSKNDVLVNHSFDIPADPYGSDIRTFSVCVPYNLSTARIVLKHNSTELANRTVSVYAPNVTVECPNGGENLNKVAYYDIEWKASDRDPGDVHKLHYIVEYSPDNGNTWRGIAHDLEETNEYPCDTSCLPGSTEGLIRVTASDGVNSGRDISDGTFIVPEKGPEVSISNPTNGTLVPEGSNISFSGAGNDLEGGELDDSVLTWRSNINGELGIGKELQIRNLTRGVHTITLRGEDRDGNKAYDEITISVIDSATIDTLVVGTVMLSATDGVIIGASRVDESLLSPLQDVAFPFGVFSFNISDLGDGQTVKVTIELPQELPSDAQYWMYGGTDDITTPHWYNISMETNEDDGTVTFSLTDNGEGDADMKENGEIVVVGAPGVPPIFDTKTSDKPYPSVSGTHTGTITPIKDVNISKLYTYPCAGTSGHTEYAEISNNARSIKTLPWEVYNNGDWDILSFQESFKLCANKTYNYVIKTGSYPQIHHNGSLLTDNGWINCTEFTDANGKKHTDWIPAIRLFS